MKKILMSILLFLLVSCGTFYQDTSPAPIEHNFKTLEMSSCGQRDMGVLGCYFEPSQEGLLNIPLWYKGEYWINSDRCHYFDNKRFEENQTLSISYKDMLANMPASDGECTFDVKVFVDKFDYGFRGQFTLIRHEYKKPEFTFMGRSFLGFAAMQIREGSSMVGQNFEFKASTPGVIYLDGCGGSKSYPYKNNPVIKFDDFISGYLVSAASCVMTVTLIPDDSSIEGELGMVAINIFDKVITTLPEPTFVYQKNKLKTTFDSNVYAAISVKDTYVIRNGLKKGHKDIVIDVTPQDEVYVRMATSNGRYKLMKVKNGKAIWTSLIVY